MRRPVEKPYFAIRESESEQARPTMTNLKYVHTRSTSSAAGQTDTISRTGYKRNSNYLRNR